MLDNLNGSALTEPQFTLRASTVHRTVGVTLAVAEFEGRVLHDSNEVAALDSRTIRAAHTLANLPDEDIKKQMFKLIAALPKRKASS